MCIRDSYFLTPKIFEKIKLLKPSWRHELEIVDALQMILDENGKISYNIINDFWKDTGTPNDIIEANKTILETIDSSNTLNNKSITGNVSIGKNCQIMDGCIINGPVIIGENCTLNDNSIIGPNVSIGDNTKIGNCKIKNSIVMNNCNIDAQISIVESIIASNSNIHSNKHEDNDKKFLLGEGSKLSL